MTENKKPEIVFMPGCFDDFEGTQEELDEMVAEIQRLVESGEIVDISAILDDLSDEEIEDLLTELDDEDSVPKRTLQ